VSEVMSGDCLQLFKFGVLHGGINAVTAYGSGGRSDHVAAILNIGGETYVVESVGGGGDEPNGIIKTPYQQWMQVALESTREGSRLTVSLLLQNLEPDYMVALLRLDSEHQARYRSFIRGFQYQKIDSYH